MPRNPQTLILLAVLLATCCFGTAAAYSTPESIVASSKIYVSGATYDPGAFFDGDTGTLTVMVTNGNSNQSIVVNHAAIDSTNFHQVSAPYDTTTNIGPLQSYPFVFTMTADAPDGTYYPTFSLTFRDADSLFYRTTAYVENKPLDLSITDPPESYTQGKKKTLNLQVANFRKNTVKNAILEVSGAGITTSPTRVFIGSVDAGSKIPVNISITPEQETTAIITLIYDNGDNPHKVTMDLPITFGSDKKAANPVMSNVQIKNDGSVWHVTGDVNNAGLENANTVMVTSMPPAVPQDPYKVYVVGALKPDNFGSFEITFTADNAQTVPIKLSYKDSEGNIYDTIQEVKISGGTPSSQKSSSPPLVPIAAGVALLVVFIGGWAYYIKRYKK